MQALFGFPPASPTQHRPTLAGHYEGEEELNLEGLEVQSVRISERNPRHATWDESDLRPYCSGPWLILGMEGTRPRV